MRSRDTVRALARGREHTFAPLGELTLKGLPEPVPASEVRWEPLTHGVPLPPRLTVDLESQLQRV